MTCTAAEIGGERLAGRNHAENPCALCADRIPRYLVFFKGRDADAVTAAFREFSAKNLAKEKKPSIRRRLTKAKEQAKRQELERGEKIKNRDRGLER